jgi:adenosylcobinamide-GDP ribazoletransferase
VVVSWAALSGFLHWDGLADVADGLGARGDAEARREVMRDSATGAFGVVVVVLVAIVDVIAAAIVIESRSWWALAAAPVLGRFGAASALIQIRPARPDGLARRFAGPETAFGMAVIVCSLVPLLLFPPDHARFVASLVGVVASQVVVYALSSRFGGITGDVLGATVLLTEAVVLVWCALGGGLM